jgi:acetyltransferase-like isoleucine patch superfamily enzyme
MESFNQHTSQKLMKDTWGVWVNRLTRRQEMLFEQFWTFYCKLQAFYWNINLGAGCRFWGKMHFKRSAYSTIQVGEGCRFRSAAWSNLVGINRPCILATLRPGAKITIGERSGFSGTVISGANSITIGRNVLCGANVTITDTDWHHMDRSKEGKEEIPSSPVVIGDNVWLGMGVTVLKGVEIGKNSVIAPYSVVLNDIPKNVLAAGQPAKIVRRTK